MSEAWKRNGYSSKELYDQYQKEYYQKNKAKILQKKKEDFSFNLMHSSKRRAKSNDIEWNLDKDFVKAICVSVCPILGIEIKYDNCILSDDSPTLDRIDNTRGYTKDNVQVLSMMANRMKSNASPDQLLKFADYIQKTYSPKLGE